MALGLDGKWNKELLPFNMKPCCLHALYKDDIYIYIYISARKTGYVVARKIVQKTWTWKNTQLNECRTNAPFSLELWGKSQFECPVISTASVRLVNCSSTSRIPSKLLLPQIQDQILPESRSQNVEAYKQPS